MARAPALAAAVLALGACSPGLPAGVDRNRLGAEISRSIGDPNTCVLVARADTGRVVYRYNTHTACAFSFPACDGPGRRTADGLLAATLKDRRARRLSCNTQADASRGVGWASGPVPGRPLVYAASMEGTRAFPGLMVAERLEGAFRRAGL